MSKLPAKPNRVSGTLRQALDLMVYGDETGAALEYDEAAKAVGMGVRAMRLAMEKAHVRAYLRQQRAILIASYSAGNVRQIAGLRQSPNQMTRLGAMRLLEDLAGNTDPVVGARPRQPGIVIVIGPPTSAPTLPMPALIGSPIDQRDE